MYSTRDRRIKTDKRNARALCEACRLGAYRPAHRTSDRRRAVRAQLSVSEALIRTRSKYVALIGALLVEAAWALLRWKTERRRRCTSGESG